MKSESHGIDDGVLALLQLTLNLSRPHVEASLTIGPEKASMSL